MREIGAGIDGKGMASEISGLFGMRTGGALDREETLTPLSANRDAETVAAPVHTDTGWRGLRDQLRWRRNDKEGSSGNVRRGHLQPGSVEQRVPVEQRYPSPAARAMAMVAAVANTEVATGRVATPGAVAPRSADSDASSANSARSISP